MYQAARAVTFAETKGDDHERHNILPRNLPANIGNRTARESELVNARLLRNQADYDVYPISESDWESDARALSAAAANFVQIADSFALTNGYI